MSCFGCKFRGVSVQCVLYDLSFSVKTVEGVSDAQCGSDGMEPDGMLCCSSLLLVNNNGEIIVLFKKK